MHLSFLPHIVCIRSVSADPTESILARTTGSDEALNGSSLVHVSSDVNELPICAAIADDSSLHLCSLDPPVHASTADRNDMVAAPEDKEQVSSSSDEVITYML